MRLREEPELAAAVVAGTLRFDGPAQVLLRVMEATAAIEEIARRIPASAPAGAPRRIASPVLRGLRSQPVTLGASATSAA
ncbi:hypothetical protein [Nocardia flavorosea]|uniref:Uncharacterized protein n=1 Tax=Nocardia flavorosea TaxID=53429 RepID=A0A846YCZ6_9NOCA|nr:hypothetical protein [Nocardia flavorosea]NKY57476.1 hypothetical protein [Nocardia flavorosea]